MHTNLIAVTNPQIEATSVGRSYSALSPEEFIVYIARVSNPSNQLNVETGDRLIRYLIKHKHWSPFEHVSCTFEIKTSRAIAAQILRHRSFTFQEFSQRYAEATQLEQTEWRLQGKTNRQVGDESVKLNDDVQELVDVAQSTAMAAYNALISQGVAKECARMILPLNTQTTIYMTGSLRSWIHYLDLRCEAGTQKEHRDIAISIKNRLKTVFPIVFETLETMEST